MINNQLIVMRISPAAKLPTREPDSVGYDVYSYGDHTLSPGETKLIPTGLHIALPEGYALLGWDRSSWGLRGITTLAGVIDPSYRGQLGVVLHSFMTEIYAIPHGTKIAQFLIQKCELMGIVEYVAEDYQKLPATIRGERGFGSSDIPIDPSKVTVMDKQSGPTAVTKSIDYDPGVAQVELANDAEGLSEIEIAKRANNIKD